MELVIVLHYVSRLGAFALAWLFMWAAIQKIRRGEDCLGASLLVAAIGVTVTFVVSL